jgi:riboflavin synthase
MFTGLIEKTGRLRALRSSGGAGRIEVECSAWDRPLTIGQSVAVQGACLTVVQATSGGFACDLLQETVERTCLGDKKPRARLNLERATRLGEPLGGHIVTGHVDAVGRVRAVSRCGDDLVIQVECDPAWLAAMIPKGSVALDGVSLTLTKVEQTWFQVNIIPHTWQLTSLSDLRPGDRANIETDVLGKYVRKSSGAAYAKSAAGSLTMDDLLNAGFA